jgi:hypothetical protein
MQVFIGGLIADAMLLHRMQAEHIAFAVHSQRDKTVLTDGHFRFVDAPARCLGR